MCIIAYSQYLQKLTHLLAVILDILFMPGAGDCIIHLVIIASEKEEILSIGRICHGEQGALTWRRDWGRRQADALARIPRATDGVEIA